MNTTPQHLTDEQFSDLLAGETPDVAAATHLAECPLCREELAAVGISMSDFAEQTAAWAYREAPARVPAPSRWALQRQALPSWRAGLTALAAAALLAVGLGYTPSHFKAAPSVQHVALPPSNAELAADNRLMRSIDQELGYDAGSAVNGSSTRAASTSTQMVGAVTN